MKLVHKITLGNTLGIICIILVAAFSYHEFDILLAKLRFVEIADNLNASFLKMRLAEKNYFLYKDKSALQEIREQLKKSYATIKKLRKDITKAIGEKNFQELQADLRAYEEAFELVENADVLHTSGGARGKAIREAGRRLRLFSEHIVKIERKSVNKIISASKRALLTFFGLTILVAITSSYLFFSRMFKNLRRIERTANAVSRGEFVKIKGPIPDNELGSAMNAINKMCEELMTRHEQLIQSKKLSSIGILTAGVAHELGNPLNNISMVAQTFMEVHESLSPEERLEYMNIILQETKRIKEIVQNLLDFSRPKKRDFKISDINHLIEHSLVLVQNMLHVSRIRPKLELQDNLPPVFIDEDKMQSVFVNLITNAIQAMSAGGVLTLRTKYDEKEDPDRIIVQISDTGKGIPAEFLSNIFDPFFSTKGTEGTGLGLSISYGIIKNHKGEIEVESEVGVGTTFTIKLPIYREKEGKDGRQENHGNR